MPYNKLVGRKYYSEVIQMNGNELNNMAKRYKEEMMRLYQKSGGNSQQNSPAPSTAMMGQNSNSPRQVSPPANPNNPSCNMQQNRQMQGMQRMSPPPMANNNMNGMRNMNTGSFYGNTAPNPQNNDNRQSNMSADCRFPSAESIISSLTNSAVTDMPAEPSMPSTPAASARENASPASKADASAAGDVRLESILINTSSNGTYALPSAADETAEILPDFLLPEDAVTASEFAVPSTANFFPSQAWISLTGDNSWGFMQAEVFDTDLNIPIQNAVVIVRKQLPGGLGLVRVLVTDENGLTPSIALPAPSAACLTADSVKPFSVYDLTVIANGYYTFKNIDAAVYAGTKTIQPVAMIPLPGFVPQTPIQPRNGDISMG